MTRTFTNSTDISVTYNSFDNKDRQLNFNDHYESSYVNKLSETEAGTGERSKLLKKHRLQTQKTQEGNAIKQREEPLEAGKSRKAFILTACLLLHFISGGTSVALGVIYVDLIRVFDAPHSQATLVQSVFMGTMIGGGVIFTSVLQKYGTGIPGIIAAVVTGLAFLASAFAPNVPTLIVLIGVIGGLSMGVNHLSSFVTVGWTFRENRKTALALLTVGWTFGQILFPYISQYLVETVGWNGSFVIMSGIILNCVPIGLLMYKSKKFYLMVKPPTTGVRDIVTDCLQDYLFVVFLVASFFYASLASVEMWFIADLAVVRGFDRNIGSTLLSIMGVFGFLGRLIAALFLKMFKIEALVHAFYAILIWGVAHFLVGYFTQLWGLVLAVVLRGLATGITVAVIPGSQIELRGIERFPQTVAICNLIAGVSSILGGLLGGVTVDLTGGYEFIFTLAAIVYLVCSIFMISVWYFSKRKKRLAVSAVTEFKIDKGSPNEKEPLIAKQ